MAENWVNKLLDQYPGFFKLADVVSGQECTRAPGAQPRAGRKVKAHGMIREWLEDVSKDLVGQGSDPAVDNNLLLSDLNKFVLDRSRGGIESAALTKSKEGKADPDESTLTKLVDEYAASPGNEDMPTLSDLPLEPSALCNKSPAERNISPPFYQALGLRDDFLSYQKPPGFPPLRNEIGGAPTDHDILAQQKSGGSCLFSDILSQPFALQGKASDQRKVSYVGMRTGSAKVKGSAATAHEEGATEEKTVQEGFKRARRAQAALVKGTAVDKDSVSPLIAVPINPPAYTKLALHVPAPTSGNDQPTEWDFRTPGVELSEEEQVKVGGESGDVYQEILTRSLNLVYNAVFLATLANILEGEVAEHLVDAGDTMTSKTETSTATSSKMFSILTNLVSFANAMSETRRAVADPTYNITTEREKYALSKGMKFDSHLVDRLKDFHVEYEQEIYNRASSLAIATTKEKVDEMMLEMMSSMESKVWDKGKSSESKPAIEDPPAGQAKDKKNDVRAGGSTMSEEKGQLNGRDKGDGEGSKPALDDVANGKGIGNEDDMPREGPKPRKHRGKKKKKNKKMPVENVVNGKGEQKEHDMFVGGSTVEKGKGKESELRIEGSATEKGKAKEDGLPIAVYLVKSKESNDHLAKAVQKSLDLVGEAIAEVLGPECDIDYESRALILSPEADQRASSAPDNNPTLTELRKHATEGLQKMLDLMDFAIRRQTASPCQLDLFCRFVENPLLYTQMSAKVDELRWNRAVVEHPHNPMITIILRRTTHIRPTEGLHHPSGISVAPLVPLYPPLPPGLAPPLEPQYPSLPPGPAPLLEPQYPPLPPGLAPPLERQYPPLPPLSPPLEPQWPPFLLGLAPAIPAITTFKKKQPRRERPDIFQLRHERNKGKPSLKESLEELDEQERIMVGKMRTGLSQPFAEVYAAMTAIGDSKRVLKEKIRLEEAGGETADRLARKLKKMAEADGVPPLLIPPYGIP